MAKFDPGCVKTHTSAKCRKYNSLRQHRSVSAQNDLTLTGRNRSENFLRARQALEFSRSQDPKLTSEEAQCGCAGCC
jgi:hypothetical protein